MSSVPQLAETESAEDAGDLQAARRVLATEAEALAALSRALDRSFIAAVDCLAAVTGRVTVTGMGKSGHIARKIAATLASTGCPAQFVHPGEASHGDLGMIMRDDALLALSNSGKTVELADLVAHCRRFGIPLIGMTSRPDSTLANESNIALILPKMEEACPMGLAPTTSTTAMMALGDALAIALLERKGFTAQDFHSLHPGGSLGQMLVRVKDLMRGEEELPLCEPDTVLSEAILTMTNRTFGCLGVVGPDRRLLGIITDGDLRRHMAPDLLERRAEEVMTPAPKTTDENLLAAEALAIMNEYNITSLFVVENGRPVGIVRMHDCLRVGVA
ncbi:MAG: KpsF/GutQ family sugar-phosphate isomerase [Kiloniellales bacterium]|nr:KpsF/GutQ family sugar-phosphate isomerase [Kiloniellales bacterium]